MNLREIFFAGTGTLLVILCTLWFAFIAYIIYDIWSDIRGHCVSNFIPVKINYDSCCARKTKEDGSDGKGK